MIATLRLLVCAGAIGLASYVLELAHPGWPAQLGTDLISLRKLRTELQEELQFGSRLKEQASALHARAQAKQKILQDLIEERLTLVETAERYRELDKIFPSRYRQRLGAAWPGNSEIERYCRQVIRAAEWELSQQPHVAAAVLGRLKAEFRAAAESGVFCLLG